MKIKSIGLFYNIAKPNVGDVIEKIEAWLKKKNVSFDIYKTWPNSIPKINMAISLGGDGTILKIGRYLAGSDIPILGVNLGSLGFLAEVKKDKIEEALDSIINKKKFSVQPRTLFDVKIKRNNKNLIQYISINDVVIKNGERSRLVNLDVSVNEDFVTKYVGDGIIVSTPTGSTAYSLSAGGPIVYPNLPVFIISAICPHAFTMRPLVISENAVITIDTLKLKQDIILSIDGQINQKLFKEDEVIIKKSKSKLSLVRLKDVNYFEILRKKLNWGVR
jgi:NAD+ kinase